MVIKRARIAWGQNDYFLKGGLHLLFIPYPPNENLEEGSFLDEKHCRNIIGLLKDAQKGLTIDEISKKIHMSRITTSKYLNSLFVSGQVNMRKVGPAKLFTLSTRLPADQILGQSSDPILILDESYIVRDISDSFSLTFGISKEELKNLNITTTSIGADLIDRSTIPHAKGWQEKRLS